MSGDYTDGRKEAREFLAGFLMQLEASANVQRELSASIQSLDQSVQALYHSQQAQIQQSQSYAQTLGHYLNMLSAQIDGLAHRLDMASDPVPTQPNPYPRTMPRGVYPRQSSRPIAASGSFGQVLGNMVGHGVDHLIQGGGGGLRP